MPQEIRYLGWRQPYAYMMLPPHLKKETRTWSTKFRGMVLITASKNPYSDSKVKEISGEKQYERIMDAICDVGLYSGFAIATGILIDVRPMTPEDEDDCFVKYREPWINKKGKTRKLYVHTYSDVKPILPFRFKGAQGWRKLNEEIISKIRYL